MAKLKERQFYILSERKRVTVPADEIEVVQIPNRKRDEGYVPALHTVYKGQDIYKFIKLKDEDRLANKYN